METSPPESDLRSDGLSPEKREDIWALLIALVVLLVSILNPEAVHEFFKNTLIIF